MAVERDHGVREPSTTLLKLRDDLVFTPQHFGSQPCYVIEDPARSKFFRVGIPEFTLISLLDGQTPVAKAVALSAAVLGCASLSEQDALAVCHWLLEAQLAHSEASVQAPRMQETADRENLQKRRASSNPLAIKLPLLNPDPILDRAFPWLAWVLGRPFFAVWCIALLTGLRQVCTHWGELASNVFVLFDPSHWLPMAATWIGLKLLHESMHGLACKKFGGSVPRAGVMFILLAPVAFVDVTSSWRFTSKWQRIATAAAGMYAELFVASLAIMIWSATSDGGLHRFCYDLAVMASVQTIVFNANPLLRFDGYFIFADLVEAPNLYASGRQYLVYLLQKHILGRNVAFPGWSAGKSRLIKVYGIAAMLWRIGLYMTLLVGLVAVFSYWGIALALAVATFWFVLPACQVAAQLIKTSAGQMLSRRRKIALAGAVVGAVLLVAALTLLPGSVEAPVVVEYAPLTVVRADCPGFVTKVCVRSGQTVRAGDVVAVLENQELAAELARLKLEVAQSIIKSRTLGDEVLAKRQVEAAHKTSMEQRQAELQKQLDSLVVRAPAEGQIVGRNLDMLVGQYLRPGTQLCIIGNEQAKELVVAVLQDDVDLFAGRMGQLVQARFSVSGRAMTGRLDQLQPSAHTDLPHPALSARAGGPIAVKLSSTKSDDEKASQTFEPLSPVFTAKIALDAEQSARLSAGQIGTVRFRSSDRGAAERLYELAKRWLVGQIDRARSRQ